MKCFNLCTHNSKSNPIWRIWRFPKFSCTSKSSKIGQFEYWNLWWLWGSPMTYHPMAVWKWRHGEVFRRIHCTAELSWMNQSDIGQYFRQFLFGCWVEMVESNPFCCITFQTRRRSLRWLNVALWKPNKQPTIGVCFFLHITHLGKYRGDLQLGFPDSFVLEVDLVLRFFAPATTTQVSCLIALPKTGTVARMLCFSGIWPAW